MDRGKEEEETIVLYFDSWPKEERCVSLPLKQVQHISIFFCDLYINIALSRLQKYHWLGDGSGGCQTSPCVPI